MILNSVNDQQIKEIASCKMAVYEILAVKSEDIGLLKKKKKSDG